jgi:hypothetical protein
MASNAILATLSHIIACSPCVGTFGRWKTDLQDDDADLWNDLTLINSIPDVRPPGIPKVVEVVSCSDRSDEDVSTLAYETIFHQHYHSSPDHRPAVSRNSNSNNNNTPREEEKSFTPSPKRTAEFLQKGNGQASRYHTHADPELEQVLEEIGLKDSNSNSSNEDDDGGNDHGDGDAELESIMGPRSQISMARSHVSRSIRRASSAPVVATYTSTRLPSLLQQQREHYHSSSRSTLARTVRQRHYQHYQHYSDYNSPCNSPSKEDSKEDQECRENFDDDEVQPSSSTGFEQQHEEDHNNYNDCDGSSYSSVCQKVSFFKRKRNSFFRSSGSSGYKKAGANGGWLPLEHSGSSTEDTTVSTTVKNKSFVQRSSHHGRLKFKSSTFH